MDASRPTGPPRPATLTLSGFLGLLLVLLAACGGEDGGGTDSAGTEDTAAVTADAGTEATSSPAAGGGEDVHLAYLAKHLDNPWFVHEAQGAEQRAEELGVQLTVQDLQFDTNLALSAMDAVIADGVDGIIIVVPEQQIGPAVIEKAAEAGVPLVAVDDRIERDGEEAPFVGQDWAEAGRQVGEAAADLYAEEGWGEDTGRTVRAVSVELQTLDVCMTRTDEATAAFTAATGMSDDEVIHLPYDGTLDNAITAMDSTITANPQVTDWVLWSCNDDGVVGAVRALENAGIGADHVIGVGLGGNHACPEWQANPDSGMRATVFADSAEEGAEAVQVLYDHVTAGTELPQETLFSGELVTPEDYETVMAGITAFGC